MTKRSTAFLLPGQGAQYARMGIDLYEREPEFAAVVEEFLTLMGEEGDRVRADWFSDTPAMPLDDGRRAQPLLFAIDYALGTVLQSRGIVPDALVGHSVGELAAAALAGVFDLPSAARIMLARSRALEGAPAGGLLAVAGVPREVEGRIPEELARLGVTVGAVNAPRQTVLAGPEEALLATEQALRIAGMVARRVRALDPFHSPVLASAAAELERAVAAEPLNPPRIPIWSGRTGRQVSAQDAVHPGFWARQMAEPVLFWPALSGLLEQGPYLLIETGPGRALSTPARRHPAVRSGETRLVCLLPSEGGDSRRSWREALEQLEEERMAASPHPVNRTRAVPRRTTTTRSTIRRRRR
ncbi:acyltransferase domain-containing protein [Streptomyces laurentii]|uniref:acyltransferase domain-containing protein n=1 Tax=Streptomyces laurentii TaxID=39478 RepID=UPI0036BCAE34